MSGDTSRLPGLNLHIMKIPFVTQYGLGMGTTPYLPGLAQTRKSETPVRPRWLVFAFLILIGLLGCAEQVRPPTPVPTLPPAVSVVPAPNGCSPWVQYDSTDFRGVSCVALFCEDGRIVRTGACAAVPNPPDQLTGQELASLSARIQESDFFAQEAYYPPDTDC